MHRFRKRSDAKRVPVPEALAPRTVDTQEVLPSLPPASDFRTSLILPDLTRRFSVLQNSTGEPIGLDELKSKFAEQRARGSQNQVTEEEEDMILEALGRLHGRKPRTQGQHSGYESSESRPNGGDGDDEDTDAMRQSVRSSNSATTPSLHGAASNASLSSAKGSHSGRRMSNNLFGSGKFRDQAYFMRNTNPSTGRRSGRGGGAIAQSDSSMSMSTIASARGDTSTSMYSDSLRPVTPEGSTYTHSTPSSPGNNSTFSKDRSSDYATSNLSKRLSKALSPDGLRRASMALDQAIRELEEEGDDEIVMERSPVVHAPHRDMNGSLAALTTAFEPSLSSPLPSPGEEAGTALSSDDPILSDENQRTSSHPGSRTTSPTPRLPGYIPGMPRPMTPREAIFDNEDLTPSATPRATSPRLPGLNTQVSPLIPQSIASTLNRSNSGASAFHRPVSPAQGSTPPLFFNRSMNGRYTPEDRQRNTTKLPSPTAEAPDSPVMGRRRPMSPLSGPAYQPLAASSPSSRPPSRPTTPSNVTWNTASSPNGTPQKSHGRNGSTSGHSRNGSTVSFTDQGADTLDRAKSTSRSLRSPALPDSPWVDNGHSGSFAIAQPDHRPPSAMSGMDLGSPAQHGNRILRSPTPTYNGARSPTSPTFRDFGAINGDGAITSARSSKQTQHASSHSFSLGTPNALLFSPIANSSRSSLESAGSSYHTWDEDHSKDRLSGLLNSLDSDYSPWHDISPDKSGPSTAGTSPYDAPEPEDAVRREVGLTKGDFVTIQDKLVGTALSKAATPENRARAGSIRRRRPSTSQSNYSVNGENRANSTPQPQPQVSPQHVVTSSRPSANDHVAKANALLNAVVHSIESPRPRPAEALAVEEPSLAVPAPADTEQSSPMRRNRALADALFGIEDRDRTMSPPMPTSPPQISIMPEFSDPEPDEDEPIQSVFSPTKPLQTPKRSDSLRHATSPRVAMPPPPAMPLSPLSPTSGMNPSELALEVQRRAEAATAALRKSPSIPKIADGSGSVPRKRISPNKISSPTLVSASTSVDAIPLRSPTASPSPQNMQTSSKIGSRFKKLRGTIRQKQHIPNGEEVTPFPLDMRSPTTGPPSGSSPSLALRTDPIPISASLAEPTRLKPPPAPLPSPPASATPGLKGFMARFRKSRPPEPLIPSRPVQGPMSATASKTMSMAGPSPEQSYGPMPHSAPALQTMFRSPSPAGPTSPPPQSPTPRPPQEGFAGEPSAQAQTNDALRQLFDAATNLGLDQAALNDLIARSPSTSSRSTAWTKLTRATSPNESRKSQVPVIRGRATPESMRSPISEGRPSFDGYSPRPSTDTRPPVRKGQESPQRPRQQQQDAAQNTVVRRTIIFPSDSRASGFDLGALVRKQSASRRRASVGSKSSIHDRVPTPPPPHRAGGRRFSTDTSPPVPQLPTPFSVHAEGSLAVPSGVETSNSAYDSLYDMYAGDGRGQMLSAESPGAGSSQGQREAIPESGPALEVIEMANGETIWSIVNGLRDDDGESYYGDRASFYSEYSVKDTNENVKLFFKEHERKSSKGSTSSSFLSRKKPQQPKGSARPETKVFFSSSAQIGRLIENLSRGMDSGSFNIAGPGQGGRSQGHVGHSTASSVGSEADARWTVEEERLEHMLGSMGGS
ncbi:uncharacterized protein TRAVEDRAFT_71059 [Trametes versicolor FP-101664 SS1]|uniref:uncharacterized protein n=1 Tax=Trametes versicolor (strain FP-101664) TaxID=717944 RepID=UPI0004621B8D|nr:uncharacterized protein TRAVEDRAFT_71059 [Trametes versicolor FP-101664 SS1]EIW60763.1 hypothetical protein TRAVEDRAFT_71059 [Trametes versicolor FP-101664 SS1]